MARWDFDLRAAAQAGSFPLMRYRGERALLIILLPGFATLLPACPDAGLGPKEYCTEEIVRPSDEACTVGYGVCSDSFACDVHVDCVPTASGTRCHCTTFQDGCHLDVTFESTGICVEAALADPSLLRRSITAGCNLGSDTDFSRID